MSKYISALIKKIRQFKLVINCFCPGSSFGNHSNSYGTVPWWKVCTIYWNIIKWKKVISVIKTDVFTIYNLYLQIHLFRSGNNLIGNNLFPTIFYPYKF